MFYGVTHGAVVWRYMIETAVKITKTELQVSYDLPASFSLCSVVAFVPTLCYFSGAKYPIFEP
jgi:hypothetical protein